LVDRGGHVGTDALELLKPHFLWFVDDCPQGSPAKYIDYPASHPV